MRTREYDHRKIAPKAAWVLGVLVLVVSLGLTSCVPEGDGREIVSVSVSPTSVSQSDAAATDWQVSMTVVGFEGAIVDADAFIQIGADTRSTNRDTFEVSGNTIELVGVERSWFGGLEPGSYQIGANVVTDAGEDVTQLDMATVTITN